MAAIVYSTSPSRVSANQNQYGSYGSVNKSILSSQHHQTQHHHTMHPSASGAALPLSIYQGKEHHNNYFMSHSRNYKRKSAVELLAETKSYYVKSENVLDRHQQLSARGAGSNTMSCELFYFVHSLSYFLLPFFLQTHYSLFYISPHNNIILIPIQSNNGVNMK